jgi:hypothetical protein
MPLIHGHTYRVSLKPESSWRLEEFHGAAKMIYNDDFKWCHFFDDENTKVFESDPFFAEGNFNLMDVTFGPEEYCMGNKNLIL